VQNAGALVTKDQLIEEVWNGRIVSEASISSRINAARSAVGDDGKQQAIIRTLPRRGFEFVAPLSETGASATAAPENDKPLSHTIRYTLSPKDGTSIAWSRTGEGPPLVFCAHHVTHLERDLNSEITGGVYRRLAAQHDLVRYDTRGTGLSGPIHPENTVEDLASDLQAVVDAAGLDRFPLVACLQGTTSAIRFAAENPDRVSRLVIMTGYARGRSLREDAPADPANDPFISLWNSGAWGDPENGFMRAWATMVMPDLSSEMMTKFILHIKHANTREDALAQRAVIDRLDARGDLPNVKCPTLVIHARRCTIHPVAEGRRVAAGIQGAEFLEVDSASAFCTTSDQTFDQQLSAVLEFLNRPDGQ